MGNVRKTFWIAMMAVLAGVAGCQKDDDAPVVVKSAAESAREAEAILLQNMPIDSGAVVSFVGPVPLGSRLMEVDTVRLTVPTDIPGNYYLCFINDYPSLRYYHFVRYARVNTHLSSVQAAGGNYFPHLVTVDSDSSQVFERIQTDTLAGVIFYYGKGGNAGFPPTFIP